ncbi:putative rsm1-like [Lyophyllum shimeji]|uniref:Rsm1-like n=1 Tax=Lyophyllum shimeji TaxID=47721 RepID=A0A9P3UNZ0_LYOSH|nr:putative rsm1-like [Lyophyllum shimeji]
MDSPTPTTSATTATPSTSLIIPAPEVESEAVSNTRTTKRKLDDAFQTLDNAVSPPEVERAPPPKRLHPIRSLYSTLAKYGIKTKESRSAETPSADMPVPSKSTPHLTAILSRAATRTRKALPFNFSGPSSTPAPPLPPTAEYRPSSIPAFLLRLSTFKLATYANKPAAIDAVAAAKCGWVNEGKDRLVCGLCKASWVVAGRDGLSKDAANALVEKQRISLVEMHKHGCPWKARQCDPTIYRVALQSPAAMVKDIKSNAIALDPFVQNIEIKHPLTSTQISSLQSTISSFTLPSQAPQADSTGAASERADGDVFMSAPREATQPSTTAILTSLFGWSLAPAAPSEVWRRTSLSRVTSLSRAPSLSRATSLVPPTPRTPPLSRAPSVRPITPAPSSPAPHGTPATTAAAIPTTPTSGTIVFPSTQFTFRMPSNVSAKRDATLLHCALCQRRVGLWAFAPQPVVETPSTPQGDARAAAGVDMDAAMDVAATSDATSTTTPAVPITPSRRAPPQRQFDLLKEHRSYCPYVVRSTVVPTLPVLPPAATTTNAHARSNSVTSQVGAQNGNAAVEGWRAVLTVVLRYGMGLRQRLGLDFVHRLRGEPEDEEPMEVDGVKAMIAGVKSRGGKDLLRGKLYTKLKTCIPWRFTLGKEGIIIRASVGPRLPKALFPVSRDCHGPCIRHRTFSLIATSTHAILLTVQRPPR